MYLASLALLYRKGVKAKTHAGLISAIGLEYVKTGEIAPEHGRALNLIEELREEVDYTICRRLCKKRWCRSLLRQQILSCVLNRYVRMI